VSLVPGAAPRKGQQTATPLLVCLDANIWTALFIALQKADTPRLSAAISMVSAMWRMRVGGMPLQLVASHELIDTVIRVGIRLGHSQAAAEEFGASIIDLMKAGPLQLDPTMLVAGRDQLAMHDREDAGVLASCIAARAHLLVTDNLTDFETNDSERIDTQKVSYQRGGTRQLFALIHRRADGVELVVMHPLDAASWIASGTRPDAETVRQQYSANTTV